MRLGPFAAAAFLSACLAAHADTYAVQYVANGNYEQSAGIDDYGDYAIDITTDVNIYDNGNCSGISLAAGQHCYETFYTDRAFLTGTSVGTFPTDPDPIAGAGCALGAGPEELLSCANGHPIYYVSDYGKDGFNRRGFYDGTSQTDFIAGGAYDGFGFESASGNFAFVDGNHEYVDLLIDETTLAVAPTPEPSSIALLSTGLLGVAGVVRKRFA